MREKSIYANIVAAMPPIPSIHIEIRATAISMKRSWLSFQVKCFILRENIGTSLTSSTQKINIMSITIDLENHGVNQSLCSTIIHMREAVNRPVAVVVRPKNSSLWRVSRLNLAKRRAANTTSMKGKRVQMSCMG